MENQKLLEVALCGYLLYGVEATADGENFHRITHMSNVSVALERNERGVFNWFRFSSVKPKLRPISRLTKPITVPNYNEGKEFVPIIELAKIATKLENYCSEICNFIILSSDDVEIEGNYGVSFEARGIERTLEFNPNHGFTLYTHEKENDFIDTCLNQSEMFEFLNMCLIDWRNLIIKELAVEIK